MCFLQWPRSKRATMMDDMQHMMGSRLTMVLVVGALAYLGTKAIHHMMDD
jgi:hypothetical protein